MRATSGNIFFHLKDQKAPTKQQQQQQRTQHTNKKIKKALVDLALTNDITKLKSIDNFVHCDPSECLNDECVICFDDFQTDAQTPRFGSVIGYIASCNLVQTIVMK